MMSQNDTDDGWHPLAVTHWNVSGFTHHTATGWLHDPAGRGEAGGALAAGITARHGGGYWAVASNGRVTAGRAPLFGDASNLAMKSPGRGYWLLASDGGIFTFGDARFHGSTGNITLNRPVVGMAASPTGRGYWITASDGGMNRADLASTARRTADAIAM